MKYGRGVTNVASGLMGRARWDTGARKELKKCLRLGGADLFVGYVENAELVETWKSWRTSLGTSVGLILGL